MTDMVRLLIDTHKADVNVITAMVRPSWYVAAEERGRAEFCHCMQGEETPLHLAVKAGHRFLVFYLITRGADVTAVNRVSRNMVRTLALVPASKVPSCVPRLCRSSA